MSYEIQIATGSSPNSIKSTIYKTTGGIMMSLEGYDLERHLLTISELYEISYFLEYPHHHRISKTLFSIFKLSSLILSQMIWRIIEEIYPKTVWNPYCQECRANLSYFGFAKLSALGELRTPRMGQNVRLGLCQIRAAFRAYSLNF
jgi:hypothetical protein